tara:strand:+ start:2464 stop:3687 length:1224 start_codon:yes stop_codon:yes gene_type:complete
MNLHPKFIDLSLKRLELLLKKLKNPHLSLPLTIHIAGTNGKGSTLSFIKNLLISNGYSCHAYISPHLLNFNERIIINNKIIASKDLYECLKYVKKINKNNPITFFEITTAAAFLLFSKYKADFLILETGLGGRLDATNIIKKKILSIITSISIDHEEFLGKTLKKITKEKLGITNYSENILIAKQNLEVNKYINLVLKKKTNVHYYNKDYKSKIYNNNKFNFIFKNKTFIINKPQLLGEHQIENASTALASIMLLKNLGYKISIRSFNKSIKNTKWPGRLEIINYKNKKIIFDGSHNINGAEKLNNFLKKEKIKPLVLFGMLNNKKIYSFLKILKNNINEIIPIRIPNEKNAFTEYQIEKYSRKLLLNCKNIKNLSEINKYIIKTPNKYVLITGSLYLVGKLREKYL